MCSKITTKPAYWVYIPVDMKFQNLWFLSGFHWDISVRWLLRTRKALNQDFIVVRRKSWLRRFNGHHHNLMEYLCHRLPRIGSVYRSYKPILFSSFMVFHRIISQGSTTDVTVVAWTASPFLTREFTPDFSCLIFSFQFVDYCLSFCFFFFSWLFYFLCFNLWLLTTSLVSRSTASDYLIGI